MSARRRKSWQYRSVKDHFQLGPAEQTSDAPHGWQRRLQPVGHGASGIVWLDTRVSSGREKSRAVKEISRFRFNDEMLEAELFALTHFSKPVYEE